MKPKIGRIVVYEADQYDLTLMNEHKNCNIQSKLPAIITAVWSDTMVNLRVICDGELDLWKTSVNQGSGGMHWDWPVIEN